MDDAFQAILSVNRPVPIAVKYLFDFLDELAEKHGIEDPETLHIWKTNRCLPATPAPMQMRHGVPEGWQDQDRNPSLAASKLDFWPLPAQTPRTAPSGPQGWAPQADGMCRTSQTSRSWPACVPSLLLRFWVNTLKNPQLIFDVRVSDNVDAILAVIAQTFMDSCSISEHKVGRVRAEPPVQQPGT